MALSLLLNNKIFQAVTLVAMLAVGIYAFGQFKYKQGVRTTTVEFLEQDLQGATNVREKAREVLDSIGDDVDVDELLRSTGGLRDEPGDVPPAE
jgi:hypothetical protein